MLTRRSWLQMNAALLALPVASRVAALAAGPQSPRLAGDVFFDGRIRDCAAFAEYAAKAGAETRPVGDDITARAYAALKPALARESGIVAGLTPEPMAFLFEVMARDVGRRQALRGEHYYSGGKLAGHRFDTPLRPLNEPDPLPGVAGHWTGELLDIMIRFDALVIGSATSSARPPGSQAPKHDFKLVSWVLAPLPRA